MSRSPLCLLAGDEPVAFAVHRQDLDMMGEPFATEPACVHQLMEAHDERRLRARQKQLNAVTLLIVDELGYVPFTAVGFRTALRVFS
ncbi:MAG: ATP-binding protein [Methylocella sp.]